MICPGGVLTVQKRQTLERQRKIRKRKGVLPPNPPPSSEPESAAPQGQADTLSAGRPAGRIPPAGRQQRRPAPGAGSGSCQLRTAAPRPSRARSSAFRPRVSASPASAAPRGADHPVRRPQRRSSSRPWMGQVGDPEQPGRGRDGHSYGPAPSHSRAQNPVRAGRGSTRGAEPGRQDGAGTRASSPCARSIVPGDFLLKCTF